MWRHLHLWSCTSGFFLTAWRAKLTLQSDVHDQESMGGGRYIMPLTDLKFGSRFRFEFYWTSWQFCSPHSTFSTFQQPPQLLRLHELVPLFKYKLRSRWKWFTRHCQLRIIFGNEDNTFIPHAFHEAASPTHTQHQQLPATNYLCSCFRKALVQFLLFINC